MEERDNKPKSKLWGILLKLLLCFAIVFISYMPLVILSIIGMSLGLPTPVLIIGVVLLAALMVICVFFTKKARALKLWGISLAVYALVCIGFIGYEMYDSSITVDTAPNINVREYLPFDENSKIVTLDKEASLRLTGELPIVDGAAAVFPVYSAFVNATYPDTVQLYDGVFEYNNTSNGYYFLADKMTDIFFGAYPSEHQIQVAEEMGTEFVYTPIGSEAFVFFVHKDNPVDSLTTEQVKMIYSGQIRNWKEVGGKDEPIAAYQRNEGSGSQSMLARFMGDTPIMEAPTEMVNDFMSGIIERVADYRSKTGSIGFSFRYYVEGIIQNPDIKVLRIDGVAPTVENIQNGTYPIVTPLYAVTWEGNDNENVEKLIQWVLSEEGQQIIEKTGYAGIG